MNAPIDRRHFVKLSLGAVGALQAAGNAFAAPAAEPAATTGKRNGPRLIVRGDDMGYAQAGNEALIKAWNEGIETTIEVIVPAPWFPEALQLLADHPSIDVGIHLAITSEWDRVKWRPVSSCPSLVEPEGWFRPMVWPNPNYPGRSHAENAWTLEDMEKEFRAQIELGLKKIPHLSHVSEHMGCGSLKPTVREMLKGLTKEYGLEFDYQALGVTSVGYKGPSKTLEEKTASFLKTLASLENGKTYLFVDHPGLDTPEVRAISHIGYENVAADRQGVTDLWTSSRVKEAIAQHGIELVSYRDVKEQAAGKTTKA